MLNAQGNGKHIEDTDLETLANFILVDTTSEIVRNMKLIVDEIDKYSEMVHNKEANAQDVLIKLNQYFMDFQGSKDDILNKLDEIIRGPIGKRRLRLGDEGVMEKKTKTTMTKQNLDDILKFQRAVVELQFFTTMLNAAGADIDTTLCVSVYNTLDLTDTWLFSDQVYKLGLSFGAFIKSKGSNDHFNTLISDLVSLSSSIEHVIEDDIKVFYKVESNTEETIKALEKTKTTLIEENKSSVNQVDQLNRDLEKLEIEKIKRNDELREILVSEPLKIPYEILSEIAKLKHLDSATIIELLLEIGDYAKTWKEAKASDDLKKFLEKKALKLDEADKIIEE